MGVLSFHTFRNLSGWRLCHSQHMTCGFSGHAVLTHGSDHEFNGLGLEMVLIALYSLERTLSRGHTSGYKKQGNAVQLDRLLLSSIVEW